MSTFVIEFGAATKLTQDYYGAYWWDAPAYDYNKRTAFE